MAMGCRHDSARGTVGGGRTCWHMRLGVVGALALGLQSLTGTVSGFVPTTPLAQGLAPHRGSPRPCPFASRSPASGSARRRCRRSLQAAAEAAPDTGGERVPGAGGDAGARAPAYRIESKGEGLSVLTVSLGGRELTFETGKIGRQAGGAVMARDGETVVYSTACADKNPVDVDFSPLRVDYMERFSAAGMTAGGYNKRDGRASDKETLVSRLMDRPLRPAMHPGWSHETQLLSWVLSFDQKHSPVPLAITSASAALALSPVPLVRAVGGVTVGMDAAGEMIINPVMDQAASSRLNLTLAGTTEGVLMIEGEGDFVREEDMMRAMEVGHAAVKVLCEGIEKWSTLVGKDKVTDTLRVQPDGLKEALEAAFMDKVDEALFSEGMSKGLQSAAMSVLSKEVHESLVVAEGKEPGASSGRYSQPDVEGALKKLYQKRLRTLVKERGVRCDGRRVDEVRPISIEPSLLPRTHGSCLFTRGDTQAIATVTLGGSGSIQKTDGITGTLFKNFYLQYTFPPSCVGETGRNGGPPGRREIGHGALAERALSYAMPAETTFPYSVRVESLITESSGSSSMASVCGGSLAMMDAGIPVTTPVAGVAMGLLLDEDGGGGDEAVILTDILGVEDALGTMDFKVAGNEEGITTFQLDIKCEGLTTALLGRALTQAKAGRLHILGEMKKAFPEGSREELSPWVPMATIMHIEPDQIGKVIGPGGKTINKIIEDFGLDAMDVEDDGRVFFAAVDRDNAIKAKRFVTEMLNDITPVKRREDFNASELVGTTFRDCEVKNIHSFGCFVELQPGVEGLVHISELDVGRVVTAEGFLANRPKIDVKAIGLNEKGKIRLSRRQVVLDDRKAAENDSKTGDSGNPSSAPSPARSGEPTAAIRAP